MDKPNPFSTKLPALQLAWDATSLNALMKCPRYYYYSQVQGYRGSAIPLEFGILFHMGREAFRRSRHEGKSKHDATREALRVVLMASATFISETHWVPWGGAYLDVWKCNGDKPYKNDKGNRAKCPYAHAASWFPTPPPSFCGECGGSIHTETRWISDDPKRDRNTAARLIVWWCLEQPDNMSDGMQPLTLPDGSVAIEYHFIIPTGKKNKFGEDYVLCGYLDEISEFGSEIWVTDAKSSTKTLNKRFFQSYSPSTQFDLYDIVGKNVLEKPTAGIAVDAAQSMVGGAEFAMQLYRKSESYREEYWNEIGWWIDQAEGYATANYWPMNRSACWLCSFNGVCSLPPERRSLALKSNFKQVHWNPLEER